MNGPAPGWQPDPTGRHEYRYWDGTKWSDDVSDGGVATTDPVTGGGPATGGGAPDATQPIDPTAQQPTAAAPQAGYPGYDQGGATSGGYGTAAGSAPGYGTAPGYGATGGSAPGATPSGGYGSGGYPNYGGAATPPGSSGPSTGLLVGLGVLVLVLVGGILFVLLGKDDDDGETATDDTTTTTAGTDTTEGTDSTTTAPPDDGGDDGGSSDAIVGALAEGILQGSGGVLDQGEAECMAQAMIDEIGVERLIELGLEANEGGAAADPLDVLSSEEQDAVYDAMITCVDASTIAELPGG
jgi:hypothetical protein